MRRTPELTQALESITSAEVRANRQFVASIGVDALEIWGGSSTGPVLALGATSIQHLHAGYLPVWRGTRDAAHSHLVQFREHRIGRVATAAAARG